MKEKTISERGQALILITLAAVALFAIAGVGIDGSAKFSDRRHAQNAADTAALAGAYALGDNVTDWTTVARDMAGTNGYNGDLVNNQIWVYRCNDANRTNAPSNLNCGLYEGSADYIEVIILSRVTTFFVRVLGINQTTNVVQAVALAKSASSLFNGASVVSMDPNPTCGNGSVNVGGNGTINLTGGGIFVNSNVGCGYTQTSCSVTLNVSSGGISSAGSPINLNGCSGSGLTTNTLQTQTMVPDEVYMPAKPPECTQLATAYQTGVKEWHITPGYYSDFPQASINGNIVGNKQNIIMDPGVYCVGKSIHWSGNTFDSLTGTSGVTIYLLPGNDFDFSINSPIKLKASTLKPYAGYLIIQDGNPNSIGSCTINGGNYLDMTGTIFAPYCNITVNGDSTSVAAFNAQVIGWDVKLNGNNTINFNYDPNANAKNPLRVGLMK